jgi:hypothetical protein
VKDKVSAFITLLEPKLIMTDIATLLSYIHTALSVLLRMSHTNEGAAAILEAGLFSAVRDSQLFATDPDIGLDVDNVEALENFYRLLISMLRILTSCVISRGSRNQHVLAQGRAFLTENRQCMQGVFKAAVREGPQVRPSIKQALEDLVGCYSALIHATDFVEVSFDTVLCNLIRVTDVYCRAMRCRCLRDLWAICLLEDGDRTRRIYALLERVHFVDNIQVWVVS